MNSLLKDDFVYLEGADGADVLFHIESIKFFRIFSQDLKNSFEVSSGKIQIISLWKRNWRKFVMKIEGVMKIVVPAKVR